MTGSRMDVLHWIETGRVAPQSMDEALRAAAVTPGRQDWHRFFARLCLWLGVVFCAAALIFFFAFNWQEMGRFAKFGLVEFLILATLVFCWRMGLDLAAGKAALLLASLFTGALLALVGQTYQTGADTYELFLMWALCILPWVALAQLGALWLFWLGLLNMSGYLYYRIFGGWFGFLFDTERMLWGLFVLNTAALCLWEVMAYGRQGWLAERWSPRVLAVASGSLATTLAIWAILDFRGAGIGPLFAYAAWMAVAYFHYRHRQVDLFVLAGGVLSAVIVVTVLMSKWMLRSADGGAFLLIGMLVIGLSAAGGLWLKNIAQEESA